MLPLALLLAQERSKGAKSFWAPYLQLLPDQPGNGWNLEGPALAAAIKQAQQVLGEPGQDALRAKRLHGLDCDSFRSDMVHDVPVLLQALLQTSFSKKHSGPASSSRTRQTILLQP